MEKGLYMSTDDAKAWKKVEAKGIESEPTTIAVHPNKSNIVIAGTEKGLYLSDDFGQTFDIITNPTQICRWITFKS